MKKYLFLVGIMTCLVGLPNCLLAQSIKQDTAATTSNNIPQNLHLSHIEIKEQFVDFKR